ncbi:hypothetical protein A2690_01785 [Candidatus Roizmanbacteria bacterium RIFCSPHIGHO2_01_FULL_39_12b]|uniref:Phosphoribosyltransferase domain-containing protein n=1 Tax=Candidatus Roizmanbacteria bacterium RIFCSPHIGHO2_01_FULL_39_12b TaxID=1802030 RepID=A0A1F7GB65_9BACT|nr:MAG: hypothetical protein A2690_01785 [Candidatus Roizmanbacteria bacterium RIFCSPHIGHO2_01_FULL_39_12b]OGK46152.1 MAG: hypothetical protein A3B46_03030 [Candidatus Roizmanbacteria bacterium RIFCSPLOWO2_01_FULL_39_19]
MIFKDRADAGRQLARSLQKYRRENAIILALPRGGIAVAYEIAKILELPLNVIISRKLGSPGNSEFGIGAISENHVRVLDKKTIDFLNISKKEINEIIKQENLELQRRIYTYRHNQKLPSLFNKTAILIDDGVATGVTAQAAIKVVYKLRPKKIVFATPVCAQQAAGVIKNQVDDFICLFCPYDLSAIGAYYKSFFQVTDEQVIEFLKSKIGELH